jgi:uncharacterized protein YndB with AHSA1/START domain
MWSERLRRFWNQRLDALVTELARSRREPGSRRDLLVHREQHANRHTTGRHMIDITSQINAIDREIGTQPVADGEGIGIRLRRTYDAPIEDVWSALTEPERMRRWFLPLSGDLRPGGSFQLEGNAGGEILRCAPPSLLAVTFGSETSVVQIRLSSGGDGATALEFEHTVPLELAGSGAGALYVGPGWDGALLALGLYLGGDISEDPVAAASSPEAQEFSRHSVTAWAAVITTSRTATEDEISAATEVSLKQFAPDLAAAHDPESSDA